MTAHSTCPYRRRAEAWWRSVMLTRKFLERIDVLPPLKKKKRKKK